MIADLLMNSLIAVLLCVTIGYCWVLNRRIKVLQDGRGELALLLKHFDDSTKRASESIIALQTASKKIGEGIQFRIEKTNYLLDDLAFMIEKGEKTANKLEASFAVNRARERAGPDLPQKPENRPVERPAQPVKAARPEPQQEYDVNEPAENPEKSLTKRERTAASLEAVLDRVRLKTQEFEPMASNAAASGWLPQAKPQNKPESAGGVRSRSKAEQELLDMIKTGIKG